MQHQSNQKNYQFLGVEAVVDAPIPKKFEYPSDSIFEFINSSFKEYKFTKSCLKDIDLSKPLKVAETNSSKLRLSASTTTPFLLVMIVFQKEINQPFHLLKYLFFARSYYCVLFFIAK